MFGTEPDFVGFCCDLIRDPAKRSGLFRVGLFRGSGKRAPMVLPITSTYTYIFTLFTLWYVTASHSLITDQCSKNSIFVHPNFPLQCTVGPINHQQQKQTLVFLRHQPPFLAICNPSKKPELWLWCVSCSITRSSPPKTPKLIIRAFDRCRRP